MNFYKRFIKSLGFEPRSAPNSDNWLEYLVFLYSPHSYVFIDMTFPHALVLFLSFIYPKGFFLLILMVLYRVYVKKEEEYLNHHERNVGTLIYYIKMKRNQSLSEILEKEPKLARLNYKSKSLLYWCKHYKNIHAHKIILTSIKSS